ncbi:GNAT family N-acetyltransferase [filamentous cyanobacterium CCP5]|nr:GNAT family N-acetyltransferase [filamentous cyanobacterium CCP5]
MVPVSTQPTFYTERLVLRPFSLADAPTVQQLAGDWQVAANTLTLPHPYAEEVAIEWIRAHPRGYADGKEVVFAIALPDNTLIGAIGLGIVKEFQLAELGYWVGVPYWGKGYCTEAARAVVDYGFRHLGLNRIQSTHFSQNPASGRVMEKAGMTREGYRPQHTRRWGEFHDIVLYGILRQDWLNPAATPDR